VDAYREELERMGRELAAKVPEGADDAARLAALRGYLFEENGFHGSRGDFYNRSNSYLNEVLDDREGLPITLSVVYLELARRIGLNVVAIGLPGHFVVRHVSAAGEGQLIDVYEGAEFVERAKAAERVKQASGRDLTEADLAPVGKRAIVLRMLGNLLGTSGNDTSAMHRYLNALLSLDAEQAQYHFLRAIVRYRLDQRDAALEDIAWLLDHRPDGIDFDRVRELQQTLQREP
jgi:regulator of sirC expression with transglutaminase-like and TPR domain